MFAGRETIGGFEAVDAVTFTFVAQALLMTVGVFGNLEMAERTRTGDMAIDLCLTVARLLARVSAQVEVRDLTVEENAIDDVVRRIYAGEGGAESRDP